jgi:hypothetical protein
VIEHNEGCPTIPSNDRSYFDAGKEVAREHCPHFMGESKLKTYSKAFSLGYEIERKRLQNSLES